MVSALITNVYAPGAFVDADVLTRAVQRKAAFLVATNVCDAAQLTEQGLGGRVSDGGSRVHSRCFRESPARTAGRTEHAHR